MASPPKLSLLLLLGCLLAATAFQASADSDRSQGSRRLMSSSASSNTTKPTTRRSLQQYNNYNYNNNNNYNNYNYRHRRPSPSTIPTPTSTPPSLPAPKPTSSPTPSPTTIPIPSPSTTPIPIPVPTPTPSTSVPTPTPSFSPTPSSSPSPSGSNSGTLSSLALSRHNTYRARHSAPALTWSDTVAATAQAWAARCVFQHDTSGTGYGENIAWGQSSITAAIDDFYSENQYYTYGVANPSNFGQVGHFTQLVWQATTQLGCGSAACSGGQTFYVCRYSPPGNMQGQYAKNVLPPTA